VFTSTPLAQPTLTLSLSQRGQRDTHTVFSTDCLVAVALPTSLLCCQTRGAELRFVSFLQAKGSDLRVHFKNSREAANALQGMELAKAKQYLEDVLDHKRAIPFRRFCGGVGRTAQVGWTCRSRACMQPASRQRWRVNSERLRHPAWYLRAIHGASLRIPAYATMSEMPATSALGVAMLVEAPHAQPGGAQHPDATHLIVDR